MVRHVSAASLKRHILFWCGVFILLALFLWFFRSILLPFIAGMALAYFLDPVADWLERRGMSRLVATLTILVAFVLALVLSLMLIIPVVVSQFAQFAQVLPGYIAQLQQWLDNPENAVLPGWIGSQLDSLRQNFSQVLGQGARFVGTLITQIWNSGRAIFDVVALLVVTPVVAFYLLYDWDRMVATVDSWIPRDHLQTVRGIVHEMDASVAGFIRGQGSLCVILGVFYAAGLSLIGVNFSLLIGLVSGLISFIPYIGTTVGVVLAVGVACVQFWPDYIWIIATAAVFAIGQFIEGNILQPKLVGDSVGLHPVWLMFALFAFGAMFGFVGLLIAVPAAAMIGVLTRFALRQYLRSDLFHGHAADPALEAVDPALDAGETTPRP